MTKPVILTGIRSNGDLTLGNYLGGILPLIEMQESHADSYQINMFVPDLHSFTTPIDHTKLYQNTIDNLRMFVAAGLALRQPETYLYRQSYVSAHSELTWILDCFAYFGELGRMTQFKEKSDGKDNVSVGLFNYPVLMAADILLYDAIYIPVGEDQRQHLELARDIAIRMNNRFESELFTVPKDWNEQLAFSNRQKGVRIRSLRNPERKMSKSVEDPAGTIFLTDTPADAAKKVMSATTDSLASVQFNFESQPGISNLLTIGALLSGTTIESYAAKWQGNERYGDLKKEVAQLVESFLTTFQAQYNATQASDILNKLESDEATMRDRAGAKLLQVQQAVGLRPVA